MQLCALFPSGAVRAALDSPIAVALALTRPGLQDGCLTAAELEFFAAVARGESMPVSTLPVELEKLAPTHAPLALRQDDRHSPPDRALILLPPRPCL